MCNTSSFSDEAENLEIKASLDADRESEGSITPKYASDEEWEIVDMSLDNLKEDKEEVLEEINRCKTEEGKYVKISDLLHCDNDSRCVSPDPSSGKENETMLKIEEAFQKRVQIKQLESSGKINPSKQDEDAQGGDTQVLNQQIKSEDQGDNFQDSQHPASMIEIHESSFPTIIYHIATNLPVQFCVPCQVLQ